jgi:ketosteroid isomerase-like protein
MSVELFGKTIFVRGFRNMALVGGVCFSLSSAEPLGAPPAAGAADKDHVGQCRPDRSEKSSLAVVKAFYENLGKGDLPAILELFAKDSKWILHGPSGIPFAGLHEGRAGIQAFIESFGKNAKVSVFETREFIVDHNKVVVLGYEEATATPTGKSWKAHWTHVFTVHRGKIVLVDEVVDTAVILAAFQP